MHATAGAITHTRNNIPALTGLRFVAAMMVVIGHGAPLIVGMPNLVNFLMPLSGAAMAPFFVLSGFVIWLNYSQSFVGHIGTWRLRRFAVARLARLWPMYTVTILIALARMAYLGDHIPKEGTILFLFGVQGWIPAIGNTMAAFTLPLVAHLWSVSAEIFLYAFFPLLCVPISRLRNVTTVACVALVNLGLATALHHFLLYQQVAVGAFVAPTLPPSAAMGWVGYYAPYPHFFEFAAGCLAARAYEILRTTPISQRERRVARDLGYISMLAFASSILLYQFIGSLGHWFGTAAVFMRVGAILPLSFLVFYAARYPGVWSGALSNRLVVLGGEASFSIYLLHPIAESIWTELAAFIPSWMPTLINFAGLLVFTVAISTVTYRLIEVPSRSFLRRTL